MSTVPSHIGESNLQATVKLKFVLDIFRGFRSEIMAGESFGKQVQTASRTRL